MDRGYLGLAITFILMILLGVARCTYLGLWYCYRAQPGESFMELALAEMDIERGPLERGLVVEDDEDDYEEEEPAEPAATVPRGRAAVRETIRQHT